MHLLPQTALITLLACFTTSACNIVLEKSGEKGPCKDCYRCSQDCYRCTFECWDDEDCDDGRFCNDSGKCETKDSECRTDEDCGGYYQLPYPQCGIVANICNLGRCEQFIEEGCTFECWSNEDCGKGRFCNDSGACEAEN